jgi:hypothetical protein
MAAFLNNCGFAPTAGGTTDWTYSSTLAGGYMSPSGASAVNGRVYKFRAYSADQLQWEIAEGAYNSAGAGSFARTTVLFNSAGTGTKQSGAGAKINFPAIPSVVIIAAKEDLISVEEGNGFTAAQQAQARSNIGAAPAVSTVSGALNADVAITPANVWVDGPSVAQGNAGTWFVSGTVCIRGSGASNFKVRLWDGNTVIATAYYTYQTADFARPVTLSGVIANPTGNLRISVNCPATSLSMVYNSSGDGKDCNISAVRLA